jgi:NAD-dependent deacetylase
MFVAQQRLLGLLDGAQRVVALTGAGISTASGIPDFRSPGGLWGDVDPMEIATLSVFRQDPERFWGFYRERLDVADRFDPNPGHYFLAHLQQLGKLSAVVTQNIDGLHQASGVEDGRVHEIHGSVRELECLHCGARYPRGRVDELSVGGLPRCGECGSVLKPGVVLFEEMLPEDTVAASVAAISECDLLLIVGSSMVVHPAAGLPRYRGMDASMVVINREATPWNPEADAWLAGDIAEHCAELSAELGFAA